ncbi:hypothetical protein ZHAS_00022063 [Anopheles sinensis]|uniref:Uncharacterized protein n=1 Tax=Anopheles sinensis TaxID=74873 RepID=A0A084WTZ5_ANOSI|nr:hypothetical protein ZHAS_00022063 [Anopheles sinensis]
MYLYFTNTFRDKYGCLTRSAYARKCPSIFIRRTLLFPDLPTGKRCAIHELQKHVTFCQPILMWPYDRWLERHHHVSFVHVHGAKNILLLLLRDDKRRNNGPADSFEAFHNRPRDTLPHRKMRLPRMNSIREETTGLRDPIDETMNHKT